MKKPGKRTVRRIVAAAAILGGLVAINFGASKAEAAVTTSFAAVDSGGVLNAHDVTVVNGEKLQIQGKVYTVIGVNTNSASGATSIRVNPALSSSLNGRSIPVNVVS